MGLFLPLAPEQIDPGEVYQLRAEPVQWAHHREERIKQVMQVEWQLLLRLPGISSPCHPRSETLFPLWKYECAGSWSILQVTELRLKEVGGWWLKLLPCISLLLVSNPTRWEGLSCPAMGSVILRIPQLQDQSLGCLPSKKTCRLLSPFPSPLISLTPSHFPLRLQGENG